MENGTRIIIKPEVARDLDMPLGRSGTVLFETGLRLQVEWDDGKTEPINADFVDPEQTKV